MFPLLVQPAMAGVVAEDTRRVPGIAGGGARFRLKFAFGGVPRVVFGRVCKALKINGLQASKNGSVEGVEKTGVRSRVGSKGSVLPGHFKE